MCASPATRRPGSATPTSTVPVEVRDWVQPSVLDIPATKIAKVTVEMPGEEPLVIARDAGDATKYTLVSIPDGKKLKEGRAASTRSCARPATLTWRTCASPRRQPRRRVTLSVAKLEADGGLGVTLKLRKEGENTWVSLEASGADGDAKKTAEEITRKTQGWEFKVPAHKAQSILKRRADLFEAS